MTKISRNDQFKDTIILNYQNIMVIISIKQFHWCARKSWIRFKLIFWYNNVDIISIMCIDKRIYTVLIYKVHHLFRLNHVLRLHNFIRFINFLQYFVWNNIPNNLYCKILFTSFQNNQTRETNFVFSTKNVFVLYSYWIVIVCTSTCNWFNWFTYFCRSTVRWLYKFPLIRKAKFRSIYSCNT